MSVNYPSQWVLQRAFPLIIRFLVALGQARPGPSIRVTSWYRDPEENIRVGGAPDSQHLLALAVDVVGEEGDLIQFEANVRSLGLITVRYATHLHVQLLHAGVARPAGLFA